MRAFIAKKAAKARWKKNGDVALNPCRALDPKVASQGRLEGATAERQCRPRRPAF
jgi:hypothetical protein